MRPWRRRRSPERRPRRRTVQWSARCPRHPRRLTCRISPYTASLPANLLVWFLPVLVWPDSMLRLSLRALARRSSSRRECSRSRCLAHLHRAADSHRGEIRPLLREVAQEAVRQVAATGTVMATEVVARAIVEPLRLPQLARRGRQATMAAAATATATTAPALVRRTRVRRAAAGARSAIRSLMRSNVGNYQPPLSSGHGRIPSFRMSMPLQGGPMTKL